MSREGGAGLGTKERAPAPDPAGQAGGAVLGQVHSR